MTLTQIPRGYSRIFFKVDISRSAKFGRIEIPLPVTLPAPEESIHQVHSHLRFVRKAIAPLELRNLTNKLAQAEHLHPCDGREQLGVMSVRQQATLPLTQSHALFLMAEPRYRAAVVHQNDIANSPNQLSLRNKKRPPSANWTAQGRLRRGTRSGRRNGVWLKHALSGFLIKLRPYLLPIIGTQFLPRYLLSNDLFDSRTKLRGNHSIGTIDPIPHMCLRDRLSSQFRQFNCQLGLSASQLSSFFEWCVHDQTVKQLFSVGQYICCLFNNNGCFTVRKWH